jgi:hypothetical protein
MASTHAYVQVDSHTPFLLDFDIVASLRQHVKQNGGKRTNPGENPSSQSPAKEKAARRWPGGTYQQFG